MSLLLLYHRNLNNKQTAVHQDPFFTAWYCHYALPLLPLNFYTSCYLFETETFHTCFYAVPDTTRWWSHWIKMLHTMLWLKKDTGKLIGTILLGFNLSDFLMTHFIRKWGSMNMHAHAKTWINREWVGSKVGTKDAHWLWIIAAEPDLLPLRCQELVLTYWELATYRRLKK